MKTLIYPVLWITAALLIGNPAVASAQEPTKLREVQTVLLSGLSTGVAFGPDGKQILTSDYFPYTALGATSSLSSRQVEQAFRSSL